MSEAVKEHTHRGVEDPEQAWILEELIRYLSHPKSGVLDFADMGESWTAVRDAAVEGSQLKASPGSLLVDTYARNARHPVAATLEELRENPCRGLGAGKPAPARFQIRHTTALGLGRRTKRQKGFIDSVLDAVISFYSDVVQHLKPFVPPAPAIERRSTPDPATTGGAGQQTRAPEGADEIESDP